MRNQPLFEALNQLSDTMRLRWHKDGPWLQFRSTSFYDDRIKEVPNRLLVRWDVLTWRVFEAPSGKLEVSYLDGLVSQILSLGDRVWIEDPPVLIHMR